MNAEVGHKGYTFVDFLKGMFINLGNWLIAWPVDVVEGLIDGFVKALKDRGFKISDEFVDLWKGSIDKVRDALKMHSPSEVVFDMTDTGVIGGALKALAAGAPRIRDQAADTFGNMVPDPRIYAPVIRVPTVNQAGGPGNVTKQVNQRAEFKIQVQGSGPMGAVRDAARDGVGLAFDDERRAMLAALEDVGGD
jgi:hypothetical protein